MMALAKQTLHSRGFPRLSGHFGSSFRTWHEVLISTDRCLGSRDGQPWQGKHLVPMTSHSRTAPGALAMLGSQSKAKMDLGQCLALSIGLSVFAQSKRCCSLCLGCNHQ